MSMRKTAGRLHWMVLFGGAAAAVVVGLLFFRSEAPKDVADQFMLALAKGDHQRLAELSVLEGASQEELAKKFDYTVHVAGPYYRFMWLVKTEHIHANGRASVDVDVTRDAASETAYPEKFAIDLVKVGDRWKVDVRSLPRGMYPGLPR